MSADGIFIHYLVEELKEKIENTKINKIYQPNPLDIVIQFRNHSQVYQLLCSASLDHPRIYLTNQNFVNPDVPGNFCMLLRKYIERGILKTITQFENDRLIEFTIHSYNELGDTVYFKLIFELMGRNSNLILVNEENQIIDAIRKLPPSETSTRIILPKATYTYPKQEAVMNPFEIDTLDEISGYQLQGVSKPIYHEIKEFYPTQVQSFLHQTICPTLYTLEKKTDFYCFSLNSFSNALRKEFSTLSELLDYYYQQTKKTVNSGNASIIKQVKRWMSHQVTKLNNLNQDLENATENIKYKDLGILLQANLFLVQKGWKEITVSNFLHNNEPITIPLNPDIEPSKNLKQIFSKGKKAEHALVAIQHQINKTKEEIEYLEDIQLMLQYATTHELEEIKQDLAINCEQFANKRKLFSSKKKLKMDIQHFSFEDVTIWIGKNNIQNDYLTHHLARNNDFWFHVQNASGAHIVVSIPHNDANYTLSEKVIRLASNLASYYSKYSGSSSVPVDYTKIKYIKKIPGRKGYFVTYTNQKTIYIDPNFELIQSYLRK